MICIPKDIIEEVKVIFDKGLTTVEREKLLQPILGAKTRDINKLYEHSLTLRNQENAWNKFVDKVLPEFESDGKTLTKNGEKRAKLRKDITGEIARKKMLMYNIDGSINPNFEALAGRSDVEIEAFTKKVLDNKYDIALSSEQTKKIVDLKNKVEEAKKLPMKDATHYSDEYGKSVNDMSEYLGSVQDKTQNMGLLDQIKTNFKDFQNETRQLQGWYKKTANYVIAGGKLLFSSTWKTTKAAVDFSYAGIQGIAILTRNPKMFAQSIKESLKVFQGPDAMKLFRERLFSNIHYDDMVEAGLRVLTPEEQFAAKGIEKIPWLGVPFKKTDDAFSIFLQNARVGEYERVLRNTEKDLGHTLVMSNEEDAKIFKELADHANKVTGTSNLGGAEKYAEGMNHILFAGRYAVSDIRMFTDILDPTISGMARKRAAGTLALHLGTLYGAYVTWAMLNPDRAEINPNNANFMKIRVGENTWVGPKLKGQWAIQAVAKFIEGSEVNATGRETVYGEGYKAKTKGDMLLHVLRGKLAPVPSVLTDLTVGSTFNLKKPTVLGEVRNLAAPISMSNIIERAFSDTELKNQLILDFTDSVGLSGYDLQK